MATHSLLQDAHAALAPLRSASAACDAADHRAAGRDAAGASDADESLVRQAQAGDREAFVIIYRRYVNEIFGYAYRQLGNTQDAEDVTSETFLRLVSALDGFDHRASFRTWLYTVARNQLRDRWRRHGRQPATIDWEEGDETGGSVVPDAARCPDAAAASEDEDASGASPWAELGRRVMAALPESYRTVLTLRIANGRSIRDVAEAMHTTPGNVKVLQHRALKRAAAVAAALAVSDEASDAPERASARR